MIEDSHDRQGVVPDIAWLEELGEGGRRVRSWWEHYLSEYRQAEKDSLIGKTDFAKSVIQQRVDQLKKSKRDGRCVCAAELNWLESLVFSGWLEKQFEPFEFIEVNQQYGGKIWRNTNLPNRCPDFVRFPSLLQDKRISLEVHAEHPSEMYRTMYHILNAFDLIRRQCLLFAETAHDTSLVSDHELRTIRFGVEINGRRVNEVEFLSDEEDRIFCIFIDDEGTVLRRRHPNDWESRYPNDPFSVKRRRWASYSEVLAHHAEMARESLIGKPIEQAAQQAKQRVDHLTQYETESGVVHFGERIWLIQSFLDKVATPVTYSDWTLRVLKEDVYANASLGVQDELEALRIDCPDVYFLPRFHEFETKPKHIPQNSVNIEEFSPGLFDPVVVFHIIHNLVFLRDQLERKPSPKLKTFIQDESPVSLESIFFEQKGDVSLSIENDYGGSVEVTIKKDELFLP